MFAILCINIVQEGEQTTRYLHVAGFFVEIIQFYLRRPLVRNLINYHTVHELYSLKQYYMSDFHIYIFQCC